jgi:hypothetical protein
MPIQTILIGNYANDGSGDDLRTAFEKVNANFATFSSEAIVNGSYTVSLDSNGNLVIPGTIKSSGPVKIIAGGDALNPNINYVQMQWASDVDNPDTGKNQYVWADTDGVHINTSLFGTEGAIYDNRWWFKNTGILELPSLAQLVPSEPGNIDLKAGPGGWAELASNNDGQYVWVDDNGVYIATNFISSPRIWQFGLDGSLTFPDGTVQLTAGGAGSSLDFGSFTVPSTYDFDLGSF